MKVRQVVFKSFGSWMKAKRKERKWTQAELARRVYCHETSIGRWEREEGCPTLDQAERIAEVFNASVVITE